MKKINNLIIKLLFNLTLCLLPFSVIADQEEKGFVTHSNNGATVDSDGDCIRTGFPSEGAQIEKCENKKESPKFDVSENVTPTKPETKKIPEAPKEKPYITFDAEIKFLFDKSNLTSNSKNILDNFVIKVSKGSYTKIYIYGHADSLGTDKYNLDLSLKRAETVKNYLINSGISTQSLEIKALGETDPIADNTTREGRAKNRRVFLELK